MRSDPVVHGLAFFPRGGSAQVVRYLAAELGRQGCRAHVVAGSLGGPGDVGHAPTFFAGLPLTAADFTPAVAAWRRGEDPLDQPVPMHPSYEDRPAAPDRVFAAVSPRLADHQVRSWYRVLRRPGLPRPSVLHLHHLTPLHEAAERLWPDVPVVTQLHGTELLMLDRIDRGDPPSSWTYADYWVGRLRATAHRSSRVLAATSEHAARAVRLLRLPPDRLEIVPNGVDVTRFRPRRSTVVQRLELLRRWLVDDPRGWDTSGRPGSVRYSAADLAAFVDGARPRPVLLYVGRFTGVKRLPLLIRAYGRLRSRLGAEGPVAPLLVWGGYPGEWEGEHPHSVAARADLQGVFFAGWRDHDDLSLALGCADLLVVPSVGEAFGAVYLEAMAAGLPVVATSTGGPPTFLNLDPGAPEAWLVRPDDEEALSDALVEALRFPEVRQARAKAAHDLVQRRFTWSAVAEQVASVYAGVRG